MPTGSVANEHRVKICKHALAKPPLTADTSGCLRRAGVRIGMRWWLAAVFVAIATLTAVLIAVVSSRQADRELRANAENIALGAGISARSAV